MDYGYYNMDCMDGMREFPDNFFDIAIVDPPYFSGPERRGFFGRKVSPIGVQRIYESLQAWEVPGEEYFLELERVSKHQIVFGCNYFDWHFPPGRIVWDKCNDTSCFSNCEIASCSLHDSVKIFRYMWCGMMQGKSVSEKHIHQTQKPVNLYRWLTQKYIQPGWNVLDTHVGSASSLIAFEEAGVRYVGFEKDLGMYQKSRKRLDDFRMQLTLRNFGI